MCSSVYAEELDNFSSLKNMNHEVNQNPYQAYQKLKVQESQINSMSVNYQLWWLHRVAQTENLLFLFDDFQQTVLKGQKLIGQTESLELLAQFAMHSGIVHQRNGQYKEAQELLKTSMKMAQQGNFTFLMVQAKNELAYTRSLTEMYELSLNELQQAYVEAFTLSDDYLIAKINEVYGAIYGYMHDYEKSIEYYKQALTSYQHLSYPYDIAEAIYGISSTYRYWGKYDLAIEYYQRYQKAIEFSPYNVDGKFYAAYGIAMSHAGQGNCTEALPSIDEAIALHGLIDYKAELYKRKAKCLIQSGDLAGATEALDMADKIFDDLPELNGTRWQIEVLNIRAELLHASGKNSQAYTLLKDFNQQQVALLNQISSDRLLRVRGALEQDKQNSEISLLQQRAKVQDLLFEQQKQQNILQTYIIAFSISLSLLILIFVVHQRRNNKKLLALSIRDPLSNLYNRRYVFSFLDKLLNSVDDKKNQVSIMVIDIDNFKQVNDTYGHPFGDCVIREIARIGEDTIRAEDIMGRVGGEEFLCVLPRINAEQCKKIAERFIKNVNDNDFILEHQNMEKEKVNVTLSIGIATTSFEVEDSNHLYLLADKALYCAKNKGKNCVELYQPYMMHSHNSLVI